MRSFVSGANRLRIAVSGLAADRLDRFAVALTASVLMHALVLSWPVPLSSGGDPGGGKLSLPALRVSINLVDEARASPAHADRPEASPAAPVPLSATPETRTDASPGEKGIAAALPLHGYYPADRLSRMPAAISMFDILPPSGGDSGAGGKLTLRIWISAKGGIDKLQVLSSSLPADYAEAALAAFGKMRFRPGEIGGVPVQAWADVVIEYADFRDPAAPSGGR